MPVVGSPALLAMVTFWIVPGVIGTRGTSDTAPAGAPARVC